MLVLLADTGGRRIPVPPGGLVLGREEGLGPPFATDDLLSREHASIRPVDGEFAEVADLGSTNGTYVNQRRLLAPARVQAGDVIRIGQIELRLVWPSPGERAQDQTRVQLPARSAGLEQDAILMAAKAAFGRKDYAASAALFAKLISSPVHAADAIYGLGMTELAQGHRPEAEKFFNECLSADGTYANAWYQLGQLREARSPADALRFYQEAVRVNPQHAGAIRKLRTAGIAQAVAGATSPTPASLPPRHHPDAAPAGYQQTASPIPAAQPRPAQDLEAARGHIRGRVAGFGRRAEQSFFLHRLYLYVWDFRIERPNAVPAMIEMRGYRFTGDISNGDIVDIPARGARPGRVLRVRQLLNVTTNAQIKTSYGRGRRTLAVVAKILLALIFLAALIGVVIFIAGRTGH